jgi:molecular chaperone DnaK (HSP70)
MSRFVVGIDLGTTNSAVACAPAEAKDATAAAAVPIRQVVGPGAVDARATLPSFLLLPSETEVAPGDLTLPWGGAMKYVVGAYARDRGAELPHRLVSSAKSWLSAHTVDRTAAVLPWRGAERLDGELFGGERVSPVNASARYLAHLRAAWDDDHADDELADQDVLLTVPASFDAVARELTAVAAREAGLDELTLLEEPQAAFYAYLAARGDAWRDDLKPGDVVLVCDVGGGTTDFSLIEVRDAGGELALERVAVGDHILLGGDNMDLTLAAITRQRLEADGKTLDAVQERALVHACRRAKEELLADGGKASAQIALQARGSKLLGKALRAELTRTDALGVLVDGFFPQWRRTPRPPSAAPGACASWACRSRTTRASRDTWPSS